MQLPVLALSQGDPAGIGPEILLKTLGDAVWRRCRPLLVAERAALDSLRQVLPDGPWDVLRPVDADVERRELPPHPYVGVLDPVGSHRAVRPGRPAREDAAGALACLDAALAATRRGLADALVTAPLNKVEIARHLRPDFRGHTEYLADACGLKSYGRDYLMAFLAGDLKVALLTTHLPLVDAITAVRRERLLDALRCLDRHTRTADGQRARIAVPGLNPHAGEAGLLGDEDEREIRPAVELARREGIDAHGPESPDSVFARARRGAFDWVLALYHDQGLIAVKTAAFGSATNWTLGLPVLRTSVDHGTAYDIAGQGKAEADSLRHVLATTLELIARPQLSYSEGLPVPRGPGAPDGT